SGYTANITQSYATGAVTALGSFVGGLVGYNDVDGGTANITQSHATGAVTGSGDVGGLVGNISVRGGGAADVTQSYATGDVTGGVTGGVGFGWRTGGLAGRNVNGGIAQ